MGRQQEARARREEISEIVAAKGFIRIDDLADHFRVTPMTVHRDLDELDARGVVSKVRSGAKATPIEEVERNVSLRRHHMLPQKQAMASAALEWLDSFTDQRVVALDDSTSALTLLDELSARDGLTVVSNFLPVIEKVATAEHATLFGLGGTFSPEFQSFQGPSTHEAIRSIQVDAFFMSATSVGRGTVFHPDEGPLLVKRALIDQSARSVLLVDHTKFTRRALHRQAGVGEFDAVIVDSGIAAEDLQALRDHVETVIVAAVEEEEH